MLDFLNKSSEIIEIDNIKYTYKNGQSYIFRAGFSHRVLNLNEWYHCALIYDGISYTLFVNGYQYNVYIKTNIQYTTDSAFN